MMDQLCLIENEQKNESDLHQVSDNSHIVCNAEDRSNDVKTFADNVDDNNDKTTANEGEDEQHQDKTFEYDVFISYSNSDRPWVKDVLLQTLEQEGKKVCVDYRDFPPGLAITDNVIHAIENSSVTILVLTPAFVESEWCTFESKRAVMASLATTKARVLPLILMECEIPNILKHLTYLDHTSEDVQPYFNRHLIDSLNNAKTWSHNRGYAFWRDVVPIDDVENVVHSTLEKRNNENGQRERAMRRIFEAFWSFNSMSCKIQCSFMLPLLLGLIAYFIFMVICIIYIVRLQHISASMSPDAFSSTSVQIFEGFKLEEVPIKAPILTITDHCESVRVTNGLFGDPILTDIYVFSSQANSVIYTRTASMQHNQVYLQQKRLFKQNKFRIHGNESVIASFCFRSANRNKSSAAALWIYKPLSSFDVEQFETSGNFDPESVISVKPQKYRISSNETNCHEAIIKGQRLDDNDYSNFVFYNPGPSPILLNVSTALTSPEYKPQLARHSCLNTSECYIHSATGRPGFVIVSKNITVPIEVLFNLTVVCVYRTPLVLYIVILVAIFLVGVLVLLLIRKLYNKKCVPRLRERYFQRVKVRRKMGRESILILESEYSNVHDFQRVMLDK